MQDLLCDLGNIVSNVKRTLTPDEIRSQLEQQHPFVIMRVLLANDSVGHVMVGYGISSSGIIHDILVMDPNDPKGIGYVQFDYDLLHNDFKYEWRLTLTTELSRGAPCCCNNGAWDADKDELGVDCGPVCGKVCGGTPEDYCSNRIKDGDETGIDCGGKLCPECTPCNNCILDEGEDAMDCGGTCTPCKYVGGITEELTITKTAQLRWEVKAFNKITAKDATTVESGKDVTFITEPTGSIVLLPGFKAEEGSTFKTQRKNLNKRLCGGSICHDHHLDDAIIAPTYGLLDYFKIYNLNYAVSFGCSIYKKDVYPPKSIYDITNYEINRDYDELSLWNCFSGAGDNLKGIVWYRIEYSIDYCNNERFISSHNFYVDYTNFKSLPADPDDPETPPLFSPPNDTPSATTSPNLVIIPNPNNGSFQIETNFPLSNIGNLKITNLMGATVYETQNVASNTVQLQSPAKGTYFVVMILKDGAVLTRKMVVQ